MNVISLRGRFRRMMVVSMGSVLQEGLDVLEVEADGRGDRI
jgi:hypothetical protein